jgi:CopG family transcriptional regulator / antitoxin EndoAI
MRTNNVRLNVTLPKDLVDSLRLIAEPRSRSRIISESLRAYIKEKQRADLDKLLVEGYRATAKESIVIAGDFEAVDLEGWNEY